jgi:TusA-related sulfurtransferase
MLVLLVAEGYTLEHGRALLVKNSLWGLWSGRDDTMKADQSLDCKGMACPMPIVKLSKAIKELQPGGVLAVVADDPGFEPDIRAWCENTGNPLQALERQGDLVTAFVRKA